MNRIATGAIAVGMLVAAPGLSNARGASAQERAPLGRIAYAGNADGDWEIFVMRADGTNVRQLTHNDVDDFEPSWSPNGRRIVFERERGENGYEDLYIVDVPTGVVRPWIVTRGVDEGDADWSPNGRWIAFRGNDVGDGADVVAVTVDRERGRIISAQSENSENSDPAWSPDGTQLALLESYEGSGLFVASFCCSHGYEKDELTGSGWWMYDVDWSPDASCIAYAQDATGVSEFYTIPATGGEPRLVHRAPTAAELGSWSPDGSRLLFDADSGESYDLYTIESDGSGLRRMTATPDVDEITASWWAPPVADPHTPVCGRPAEPQQGLPPES